MKRTHRTLGGRNIGRCCAFESNTRQAILREVLRSENSTKHFLRLVALDQDFVIGSAAVAAMMLVVLLALQWA